MLSPSHQSQAVQKQNEGLFTTLSAREIEEIVNSYAPPGEELTQALPFNSKVILSFAVLPLSIIKATIEAADKVKVKKALNTYINAASFLHIASYNPDLNVFDYLLDKAIEYKIDYEKLLYVREYQGKKSSSLTLKLNRKTYSFYLQEGWTVMNIALAQGDRQKIQRLHARGFSQVFINTEKGGSQGSLFSASLRLSNNMDAAKFDFKTITMPAVYAPRLALVHLALAYDSWPKIFGYALNDSHEDKLNKATLYLTNLQAHRNFYPILFQSPELARDSEFKTLISLAVIRACRDSYYGSTSIIIPQIIDGIAKHIDMWSLDELTLVQKACLDNIRKIVQEEKNFIASMQRLNVLLEQKKLNTALEPSCPAVVKKSARL